MSYMQTNKAARAVNWYLITAQLQTKRTKALFNIAEIDTGNIIHTHISLTEAQFLIDNEAEKHDTALSFRTIAARYNRVLAARSAALACGNTGKVSSHTLEIRELKRKVQSLLNCMMLDKEANAND